MLSKLLKAPLLLLVDKPPLFKQIALLRFHVDLLVVLHVIEGFVLCSKLLFHKRLAEELNLLGLVKHGLLFIFALHSESY